MPPLIFLTRNGFELGAVTVTSAAAGFPKERLFDRDRGPQWMATSTAQQDIDLDLGVGVTRPANALGLGNHNITATLQVFKGSAFPPSTLVASPAVVAGVDALATWAGTHNERFWRVRLPALAAAAAIGELMLDVPGTMSRGPVYPVGDGLVGNAYIDVTPGGYTWGATLGPELQILRYTFERTLPDADWGVLKTAFRDVRAGSRKLLVRDLDGVVRWVRWIGPRLDGPLVSHARRSVVLELHEAL